MSNPVLDSTPAPTDDSSSSPVHNDAPAPVVKQSSNSFLNEIEDGGKSLLSGGVYVLETYDETLVSTLLLGVTFGTVLAWMEWVKSYVARMLPQNGKLVFALVMTAVLTVLAMLVSVRVKKQVNLKKST